MSPARRATPWTTRQAASEVAGGHFGGDDVDAMADAEDVGAVGGGSSGRWRGRGGIARR